MEPEKPTHEIDSTSASLLAHYSNEVCSHVEGVIALFFSLIGTLIIMTEIKSVLARTVFSVAYFALGLLAVYFYVRLFYYRKLLEGVLLKQPHRKAHFELEKRVFRKSKLIEWFNARSRSKGGEYRLGWAWFMLVVAIVVATSSWMIVFFSLWV